MLPLADASVYAVAAESEGELSWPSWTESDRFPESNLVSDSESALHTHPGAETCLSQYL
jgi:hypothetical protein